MGSVASVKQSRDPLPVSVAAGCSGAGTNSLDCQRTQYMQSTSDLSGAHSVRFALGLL